MWWENEDGMDGVYNMVQVGGLPANTETIFCTVVRRRCSTEEDRAQQFGWQQVGD